MPTNFEIKVLVTDKTNTHLFEKVFVKIIGVSGGCWNYHRIKFSSFSQLTVIISTTFSAVSRFFRSQI